MITQKHAERRVAYWLRTLHHLGISHWDVVVEVEPTIEDHDDAYAVCYPHHLYDNARIVFTEDAPADQFDRIVVHELLHLVFRDVWETCERPTYQVAQSEGFILREVMKFEFEGVIDRLARAVTSDLS